jgi:hypothetical protein
VTGDIATAPAGPIASLGHNGRVYVIPEFKLVYASVAKNACTAMKWVMADLAREDVSEFHSGLKPYTAEEHAVHNRDLFKKALYPDEVDPKTWAEIAPDTGWFIFGILRDPRSRLFSAWQDKLLMQDPAYRWLRREPWYPEIPRDADAIIADFARFVDAFSSHPQFRLRGDTHFRPQVDSLMLDKVPYSRLYSIDELAALHIDLTQHVAALGWHEPLNFRRSNDTPLRANAAAFPDDVREKVEAIYAADFEAFGGMWDFGKIADVADWSPAAVREVQVRGALGVRLGDVRQIALDFRKSAERAARRADKLERQLKSVRKSAERAAGRADKLERRLKRVRQHAAGLAAERRAADGRRPVARMRRLARRILRRLPAANR